jgi:hypothetical protein
VRKIVLIGAVVLLVGSAHAQATKSPETAPATPPVSESPAAPTAAVAAPAAPAVAEPAAAQDPATQAQPAVAATPTPKPSKKRQAKRYESDEQKARRIAARYGISW